MNDDSYSGNNSGLSSFHPTFCLRGMDSFNIKIYWELGAERTEACLVAIVVSLAECSSVALSVFSIGRGILQSNV